MTTFDRIVSTAMALAAVAVATVVVRSQLKEARPSSGSSASLPPVRLDETLWEEAKLAGRELHAPTGADAVIVVLTDFECPACRVFHERISEVVSRSPVPVAVRLVHTPLPYHRFALPAARVVECGAEEGRFPEMVEALFRNQDSLGIVSWSEIARQGAARSPDEVAMCATGKASDPRFVLIDEGMKFSTRMELEGTPTVLVNGWRFNRPPTVDQILEYLRRTH